MASMDELPEAEVVIDLDAPLPPPPPVDPARRRRGRLLGGLVALGITAVAVPTLAMTGGGLPAPPTPREPQQTPAVQADEDRVPFPPPWVLPPEERAREAAVGSVWIELETHCAKTSDEEFRSLTVVRATCQTEVKRGPAPR